MSALITTVLVFALLTAFVEFFLLYHYMPLRWLKKKPVQFLLHFGVAALNLAVHWGTIVGTMTAISALLISFATVPLTIAALIFMHNYRRPNGTPC